MRYPSSWRNVALLFTFVLGSLSTAFARPRLKVSPDLASSTAGSSSVIIQYNVAPNSDELAQLTALGGSSIVQLNIIKAVQVTLPSSAFSVLMTDSNVKYISLNRTVSKRGNSVTSVATSAEFTVEPINAPAVWALGYTGTGIGVAVIDSGVSTVPDLQNRIVYGQSFLPAPAPPAPPAGPVGLVTSVVAPVVQTVAAPLTPIVDQYGHGTHVAGLIAGNGAKSSGGPYFRTFKGVAPNANIVDLQVLDGTGAGNDLQVIEAIQTAIQLQSKYNIRVINLSLGRPIWESYTLDPLCQAVEAAWQAGIVVVTAAGNDGRDLAQNPEGYGTIEAPGNDPYVITVGATNPDNTATVSDDVMASYSSKGPSFIDQIAKPDIVAPGNLVTSLLAPGSNLQKENPTFFTPMNFYHNGANSNASTDYMPLSGTSMATAVTSGAAALLIQSNPQLTPDMVKALLMRDANKTVLPLVNTVTANGIAYVANNDVFTVGAGYLDIYAAVTDPDAVNASLPAGFALSPTAAYDPNTNTVTLNNGSTVLWGKGTTLGAADVYGQNAFVSGSTVLWGKSGIYGASDPDGMTVLWGKGSPDAASALWGAAAPGSSSGSDALWGASGFDGANAIWDTTPTVEP